MSQRRRGPGVPRADEVPFGIRALERGVEVEGVWVSRGNTPEPSIRHESSASSIWDFMPKKASQQDVERQDPEMTPERGRSNPNLAVSMPRPISLVSQRPSRTEDPENQLTRDSSPRVRLDKPSRSQHPPPSFAKYSGNPSLHRFSPSVQTFEGIEAVYRASTCLNPESRHGGSSSSEPYTQSSNGSSSNDSNPISSAAPKLLTHKSKARPRQHSADFELLNSHHRCQAAEIGQFTPRKRKPTWSAEVVGYMSDGVPSSGSEDAGYSEPRPAQAAAVSAPSSLKNDPSPPKIAALPAAVRRSSLPNVTSFAQFLQTAPALPQSASPQSLEEELQRHRKRDVKAPITMTATPPIQETASSVKPEDVVAGAVQPSFEKTRRPSQVIRGHGTGFEILKPGSLEPLLLEPSPSPSPERKHRVPPVSLHSYARSRSRSSSLGSTGRKLQKKRRLSIGTETSLEGNRERRRSAIER